MPAPRLSRPCALAARVAWSLPTTGRWPAAPRSGDIRLRVGVHFVRRRTRIEVAAGLAGAQVVGAVEALEHAEEILLDVAQVEEFLVELVVAAFAEPHQPVVLVRQPLALDHQADRTFRALWRMRHARRQQEGLAGADRDIAHAAVLLDAQHHLALELVEPLRTFLPVVVGARIRAADHHDDEVAVVDALVAHRRPEQVAVLVDPLLEIQRRGDHGGLLVSGLRGRPGSGPGPGRTVRPAPVRCPRPGPGRARGRRAGYRP